MGIFSQFFVLSARGDTIVSRDYRGDVGKGVPEIFFQAVKHVSRGDPSPIFTVDGIHFVFTKQNGLYFVLVSRRNVSPFYATELLIRLVKIFRDYCGIVTEESLRKNFVLVYELLDEVIDFGVVQSTTTEALKGFVHEVAVQVDETAPDSAIERMIQTRLRTAPSTIANRSVQDSGASNKDEIFVDLLEKLSVLFSSGGNVVMSRVDGCINMRSFLKGNPELRLGLNEDLLVGSAAGQRFGRVCIDDITFHDCARTSTFEFDKSVVFHPPDGEFVLLAYRCTDDFRVPFRITPYFEELGDPRKIDLVLKMRLDVPEGIFATNVSVYIPVPKSTTSCTLTMPTTNHYGHTWEYRQQEHLASWNIKKVVGEAEMTIRVHVTVPQQVPNLRKEFGNISMQFEIPMYTCTNVTIRYLKTNDGTPMPNRWVRLITSAASYVHRL
jgi:AP-4 complex subunit mu-1